MENELTQKDTFKEILVWFCIIMILLPPFAALNSAMTRFLDRSSWYKPIQTYIVPWQARMVSKTLSAFGVNSKVSPGDPTSAFFMIKNGAAIPVDLSWNCLGWQSVLLLLLSFGVGLRGDYDLQSRVKIIIYGVLGTVLINVFRMSLIAFMIYYVNSFAALVVHDYFAAFITLIWLLVFWQTSYKYILVSKQHLI